MKLTAKKSTHMDDWYVIERADHDRRESMVRTEHGVTALKRSARIVSDGLSCVEGTGAEMLALACAIERRGAETWFKRCAVAVRGNAVDFWSPRNSNVAEADDLAAEIRRVLARA